MKTTDYSSDVAVLGNAPITVVDVEIPPPPPPPNPPPSPSPPPPPPPPPPPIDEDFIDTLREDIRQLKKIPFVLPSWKKIHKDWRNMLSVMDYYIHHIIEERTRKGKFSNKLKPFLNGSAGLNEWTILAMYGYFAFLDDYTEERGDKGFHYLINGYFPNPDDDSVWNGQSVADLQLFTLREQADVASMVMNYDDRMNKAALYIAIPHPEFFSDGWLFAYTDFLAESSKLTSKAIGYSFHSFHVLFSTPTKFVTKTDEGHIVSNDNLLILELDTNWDIEEENLISSIKDQLRGRANYDKAYMKQVKYVEAFVNELILK